MHKYGDAVVLLSQNSSTGEIVRTNAIVLSANLHVPMTGDRQPIAGAEAEAEEHLDLAVPVASLAPDGSGPKTRNMEELFRPVYGARPSDGGSFGWVPVTPTVVADAIAPEAEEYINGSPRAVVDEAEIRARVMYEKAKEIDALTADLKAANDTIGELITKQEGLDALAQQVADQTAEIERLKALSADGPSPVVLVEGGKLNPDAPEQT